MSIIIATISTAVILKRPTGFHKRSLHHNINQHTINSTRKVFL